MMLYRLKEVRKSKGMTQTQLSEKSTVCRATINGIERGTVTEPKVDTLVKLASALDCQITDLFLQ